MLVNSFADLKVGMFPRIPLKDFPPESAMRLSRRLAIGGAIGQD
jgi:hypothetical protein